MSKSKWMMGLVSVASLVAASTAGATTLSKLKFDEMVNAASVCVMGDAVSSSQETRNGQVVTLTTFNVTKTAFGTPGSTITVRTAGGKTTMGRLSVSEVVAGSPQFFSGTDNVMLLSLDAASNEYSIVGFNQGLFPVGNSTVQLPQDAGGQMDVDEAIDLIRQQRALASENLISE